MLQSSACIFYKKFGVKLRIPQQEFLIYGNKCYLRIIFFNIINFLICFRKQDRLEVSFVKYEEVLTLQFKNSFEDLVLSPTAVSEELSNCEQLANTKKLIKLIGPDDTLICYDYDSITVVEFTIYLNLKDLIAIN